MLSNGLNTKKDSSAPIDDTTTYEQIYGRYENREPYLSICNKESCIMFQAKFKAIYDTGREYGLQAGEVLQLILKATNGKYLDQIPYGELSSIKHYVKDNAEMILNILNPTLYGTLNYLGYYQKDRYKLATREELSAFSYKLFSLLAKKAAYTEFYQLAKDTANSTV